MIVSLDNPRGLDARIKQLQSWLQAILFPLWGLDPEDAEDLARFIFYPRVFRNQDASRGGYIAELYTGDGQYQEVFYNDALYGQSFFGLGSRLETEGLEQSVDLHLVTFANVKKLYPDLSHRADNEIRSDFQKVFEAPIFGFSLVSTEIWLANVLREYPGSRREDRLIAADMGEVHAFRLNLKLVFNPAQLC
jgi:hypothetical protein